MTVLDDILDASTDPSVPAPDLLRKVQIAAHRLGAHEIVAWVRGELGGYADGAEIPKYRILETNVMGLFTGPMQSRMTIALTVRPKELEKLWLVDLHEPLVELQSLADASESDPQREWSAHAVDAYERSGALTVQFYGLFSAWNVITRQSLRGVVDIVRSRAMEFALELQSDFPEAGSVGGPTVDAVPALASTVFHITNNITGHGTNIAAGGGATQTSIVAAGDEDSLRRRMTDLGLVSADQDEFITALREGGGPDGQRAKKFLEKVRAGAITVAAGLATDTAAELLVSLGRSFLGLDA